jgi:hypothetical protein
MKKFILSLFLVSFFAGMQLEAQQFVVLKAGKTTQINGISVSYIAAIRKTKKGEDYYRATVSITNNGGDYQQLFSEASKVFTKIGHNALAFFQFVNATGRGFSAVSGKLYARPLTIVVPYKSKKCPPPTDSKEDPYNHYVETYYIGMQFPSGATISKSFSSRVPEGVVPVVRVMIR